MKILVGSHEDRLFVLQHSGLQMLTEVIIASCRSPNILLVPSINCSKISVMFDNFSGILSSIFGL